MCRQCKGKIHNMAQMQNAQSVALQLEKVRDKLPLLSERNDAGGLVLVAGFDRNCLDFEAGIEKQRAGTDEGAGWKWRVEIGAIHLVESVEE